MYTMDVGDTVTVRYDIQFSEHRTLNAGESCRIVELMPPNTGFDAYVQAEDGATFPVCWTQIETDVEAASDSFVGAESFHKSPW